MNTDVLNQDLEIVVIPLERIVSKIFVIREERVMLDSDLAELYGVATKVLNQQVKRNIGRFPGDFMFQLSHVELESLRSQIVTSNRQRGGRRSKPYVFTENGVAMLSSVLQSKRAVNVNIQIMRSFTKMRKVLGNNEEMLEQLNELKEQFEAKMSEHEEQFAEIFEAIRQLVIQEESPKRKIGFQVPTE